MNPEVDQFHIDIHLTTNEEILKKWTPRLVELLEWERRLKEARPILRRMDDRNPQEILATHQEEHPDMGNRLWSLDVYHVRNRVDLGNLAVLLFGDIICINCNHKEFCPKTHCLGGRQTKWDEIQSSKDTTT